MKFIKATCPGCGASLELADHLQSATCPNCDSKVLIDWETKQNPAAYLELAKRFIQSGNYKEADVQLTRVLEMSPDNKEAWFWKWVALEQSRWVGGGIESSANSGNYLEKAAYSNVEISERLLSLLPRIQLNPNFYPRLVKAAGMSPEIANKLEERFTGDKIASWFFYSDPDHGGMLYEAQELALRAKQNPATLQRIRQDRLTALGNQLRSVRMYNPLKGNPTVKDIHRLFELIGADQPDDWVEALVLEMDWRGNRKAKEVKQKPSYWRKWLEELERKQN